MSSNNFHTEYTSSFTISKENQQLLTHYKYLKWESDFFLAMWESNIGTYAAGTISRYNNIFHVSFTNGVTIGKLKQLRSNNCTVQLALSFRKAAGLPAYVIVGLASPEASPEQGE